jgi:hypothetical protein
VAFCPWYQARVRGRHPEQTSEAPGAAAVQLGARPLGPAADLKRHLGVWCRKAASLLLTLTRLVITASAPVRSGHRLRRHAQATYND